MVSKVSEPFKKVFNQFSNTYLLIEKYREKPTIYLSFSIEKLREI
jgi:hypothetical protein